MSGSMRCLVFMLFVIRFSTDQRQVYLAFRVEVDKDAKEHGVTKASEFANVYQKILDDERIRSSRVMVTKTAQIHTLDYRKKF